MKTTDILVVGSGIAGLLYALEVSDRFAVCIVSKREPTLSNTRFAQGGIASVTAADDTFDSHLQDTLIAGDGLCDEGVVRSVIEAGPSCIECLLNLGVSFDRDTPEQFSLGREGGHSQRRILHAGDSTGLEILRALYLKAQSKKNITILENHIAIDLITAAARGANEVLGAYVFNERMAEVTAIASSLTMLASGGAGKVYLYTSNPDVATGDGIAMAYRAGAKISNMEFFQFHPTCLYHEQARTFLISEAMRGEGAKLLDVTGKPFMELYDPRCELAPRDVVARAIDAQMKKTGTDYVLLDISHRDAEFLKHRFPTIYKTTKELGFDITKGPIPVVPAAHYCCGGVASDLDGRTSLSRLYVAGESACTGLHGANRLASNSLLEAIYFARRAARDTNAALQTLTCSSVKTDFQHLPRSTNREDVLISYAWDEVRRLMWNLVGIVRSDKRLSLAERRIHAISAEVNDYYRAFPLSVDLIELRNITLVAEMIIRSSSLRKESRGLHYNIDYPQKDDIHWLQNTVL